jgi:hypothetical protein
MPEHQSTEVLQPVRASTPRTATGPSPIPRPGGYRYLTVTVKQAIELTETGVWQVPDFQREFIWKPSQICELADSLWRGYPIGALLLWLHRESNVDATSVEGGLIADGLHRLTSLCLLFGREPAWLASKPAEFRRQIRERFAVYFDIAATDDPRFVSADSYKPERPGLIPLKSLFDLSSEVDLLEYQVRECAQKMRQQGCRTDLGPNVFVKRLRKVAAIRDRELLVTALHYERNDRNQVIEIFQRLNSRGMKFRRLLLKFAMQGISGSLLGLRMRRGNTGSGMIGR